MRNLLRSKARALMQRRGICHMNKARYTIRNGAVMRLPSYFAEHWREVAGIG